MRKFSKGPALSRAEGFTIIELIVVIAIIAVLAGIVLVNVTQYINKSKDTAIKANMATLLNSSAVFFADPANSDKNGENFLNDPATRNILQAISDVTKNGDYAPVGYYNQMELERTSWAICAALLTGDKAFCVDSTGTKKEEPSNIFQGQCDNVINLDTNYDPVCR